MTYSNAVKVDMLGMDPSLIEAHGAVSEGGGPGDGGGKRYRGPIGGTLDNPVGTVWLASRSCRDAMRTIPG